MNKEAMQEATKRLAIKMVYLENSEIKLYNGFDPLIPDQQLTAQFRIGTKSADLKTVRKKDDTDQRFYRFHVSASMRYLSGTLPAELEEKDIPKLLASEITALFIAEYAVIENKDASEEAIQEFGRVNAPFHVWPYWREYSQSTCSRMAFPATIVPMLTID